MTLPDWLRDVLADDTAATWELLAPVLPSELYLAGGTALAVHVRHRVSRDLDFFYHDNAVDLDALRARTACLHATPSAPDAWSRRSDGARGR